MTPRAGRKKLSVREHRFLDLARIGRVADQDDLAREVDGDDGLGAHPVALGIGLEGRQIDDGELGDEIFQLRLGRPDQQLPDEQRVPGVFGKDPGIDPVFRIGAAIEILGEQLLAAGVRDEILVEALEVLLADLAVALPPDRALGERVDDGVLVLRAAAGMDAGLRADRAALHDRGLAGRDGMLVERRRIEIPVDRSQVLESEFVGAVGAVPQSRFLHDQPPPRRPAAAGTLPICRVLAAPRLAARPDAL